MPTRSRFQWPTIVALAAVFACGGDKDEAAEQSEAAAAQGQGGMSGKVTKVTGPSGLTSDALAAGTFLGQGASLEAGQSIETPKGTLAEVELEGGARVRLNEETTCALPGGDHPGAFVVTRGEIVAIVHGEDANDQLTLAAGEETLRVLAGEVQVQYNGDKRHFAVVHGRAVLETGGKELELGAGESVDTPLPVAEAEPEPVLSLRPLGDTEWARTFDTAARLADSVPRGVGSLTARRPGSSNERQQLRLTDQRVTVNIAGRMAHTEIEQEFFNDQPAVLEGIYRFPMPVDGSISGLQLLVGNTWMEGEVLEKQRARAIFKSIVDATVPRDPALLEWERGNIFKLRIFPIPGRGERRVRLSYTQVLPVVGDNLRYRYPLGGSGATDVPIDHFEFTMNIDRAGLADAQVANLSTPMLALDKEDRGDRIELHTERDRFLPTFDLGVDIPVPAEKDPVHASTHLDKDGQAYFMLTLAPEFELGRDSRGTNYAFVVDRSHSTTPELWTVGRGLVDAMTELMDEDDKFTVLACDTDCDEHLDGLQQATPEAVDRALRFLEQQDLAGASDVGGMLQEAARSLDRSRDDASRIIVYLGDGSPSSGELAPDKLAKLIRTPLEGTRVLAVALGARSDLTALGAVVNTTGGDLVQADSRDNLRTLVRELRLKAEVPAARNVEFDLPKGMAVVREENTTSVRPGDSIVLAGKLRHPVQGEVVMRADGPNGPVQTSFPVNLTPGKGGPAVNRHLPRTWAKMQIAHLTNTQGFGARDEIISLSQQYTVLSRFTAMLVLENDAMFREFNVVRQAKDTDKWKGELPVSEDPAPPKEADNKDSVDSTLEAKIESGSSRAGEQSRRSGLEKNENSAEVLGGVPGGSVTTKQPPATTATPVPDDGGLAHNHGEAKRGKGGDGFRDFDEPAPEPEPVAEPTEPSFGDDLHDFGDGEEDADGDFRSEKKQKKAKAKPKSTSSGRFAPPPPAKTPAKPGGDFDHILDPKSGGGGKRRAAAGGGSGWMGRRRPPPRLLARVVSGPGSFRAVDSARQAVSANPTSRVAHGKLVRAAIRTGHPESLAFAQAWAEVDPDNAGALLALADALSAVGNPVALRAYESVVDVSPFSRKQHENLANAFAGKGDLRRSCSHRRAVVSIDPSNASHHAELAACLKRAGRIAEARFAITDGRARSSKNSAALDKVASAVETGVGLPEVQLHGAAALKASIVWDGEDDLDIVLVDSKGRRLSAMRPEGIRVRETASSEQLTMRSVRRSVFIEVTRVGSGGDDGGRGAITGQLTIRTPNSKKAIPVTVTQGTKRVAKVFWTR